MHGGRLMSGLICTYLCTSCIYYFGDFVRSNKVLSTLQSAKALASTYDQRYFVAPLLYCDWNQNKLKEK